MFIESIQQVANAAAASEGSTKKLGKLLLVISGIWSQTLEQSPRSEAYLCLELHNYLTAL